MIDEELKPEHISLTEKEFQSNCTQLEKYNASYQSRQLMESHLRGEVLQTHTTVAFITNSEERKLIATQAIPAGTILGMYFGKVYPANSSAMSPRLLDISKYEAIFNDKGESLGQYLIVGEFNEKLTLAATMNHAYSAEINNEMYSFGDNDTIMHVATRNVQPLYFNLTLTQKNKVQHIIATALVALRNIYPGEALLISYDDPFSPSPVPHYWESRQITPLLFTKSGDYLPSHFYSFKKVYKPVISTTTQQNKIAPMQLKYGRLIFIIVTIMAIALFVKSYTPPLEPAKVQAANLSQTT